ncbi:MAG: hypothetical protein HS116_18545 [Planctomycetes bacterium]|nr:hypothetical protein [Planctomycetota bacterium]
MRHDLDKARALAVAGQHDEAEHVLRSLEPSPRVLFNLGWHLCRRGHWRAGLELMHYGGREAGVFGSPPIAGPLWNFENLEGKTVLLRGEGGFGDEICNVRWAEPLSALGARVIATCQANLLPVLATAPGVALACAHGGAGIPTYDYWLPAMSGPYYFDVARGAYLMPPFERRAKSERFTVGVCWAGNPEFEHDQRRRFPIEPLLALREHVRLVSFQRDHALIDLPAGVDTACMTTWAETAGELVGMDLVISSCTAVAHLAAALGIPTWILIPRCPYYPWAVPGTRSVWYDSVRLYRQTEDWPFAQLKADLEALTHAA